MSSMIRLLLIPAPCRLDESHARRVTCILLHRSHGLAQHAPSSRQPRHHRADRNTHHGRNVAIAHILELPQYHHFTIFDREHVECPMHETNLVAAHEQCLGIVHRMFIPPRQRFIGRCRLVIRDIFRTRAPPAPFCKPRVPHNRKQPGPRVVAIECLEESKRAQIRILDDIVGIARAARQPAREVIRRIKMRQRKAFKARATLVVTHDALLEHSLQADITAFASFGELVPTRFPWDS
ncbi:protein of unknown function [Pararobbsia alpina]